MNRWIEKDREYIWHPYTQMKDCETLPPILVDKAEGIKLYDDRGQFYYDTVSSWWCNVHGHNHPKIKAAIAKQLDKLEHVLFAGFTHKPAIRLAERLVAVSPENLTKVFFSDNGSTAVETALKMSFQYWHNIGQKKKKKFVALDHAYHGDTLGAMGVGAVEEYNALFSPLFVSSYKVASPYCYRCPVGKERSKCNIDCIGSLEDTLKKHGDNIAALILEPMMMGAAGIIVYPGEYLRKAAELAKKYNVHLIADEVATGFGRTGKMFACEHADVEPDFMCLSKGITSGYLPLAATLTTEKIYDAFYDDYENRKTFCHGHTYTANPIACAAAVASLELFEQEDTVKKANQLEPILREGLEKMRELRYVGDVRTIGMIGAVELVSDKKSKKPFVSERRIGLEVYKMALERNLLLRPLGNVSYLFLPLCVKAEELTFILDNFYAVIKDLGDLKD
ncbi:MAG: adenosylmethionine--8-amino-7-oxononanoate transaminase [Planctomycetota bacterium]|jgi:adenosylmethionine-8-amino-7-oxononanoate aminotransferase